MDCNRLAFVLLLILYLVLSY